MHEMDLLWNRLSGIRCVLIDGHLSTNKFYVPKHDSSGLVFATSELARLIDVIKVKCRALTVAKQLANFDEDCGALIESGLRIIDEFGAKLHCTLLVTYSCIQARTHLTEAEELARLFLTELQPVYTRAEAKLRNRMDEWGITNRLQGYRTNTVPRRLDDRKLIGEYDGVQRQSIAPRFNLNPTDEEFDDSDWVICSSDAENASKKRDGLPTEKFMTRSEYRSKYQFQTENLMDVLNNKGEWSHLDRGYKINPIAQYETDEWKLSNRITTNSPNGDRISEYESRYEWTGK